MKSYKDLLSEVKYVASADFKISPSGRKVHKMKKIADTEKDDQEQKPKDKIESVVPAHMQGKQKPYVSSDGKGNYEVLGNKGQTKATFSRKEHGKDAQKKAQAHLRSKYDEYMKEETELEEAVDKSEQRFLMLARLGLVAKSDVSKLRIALDQLKADKPLTVQQRNMLLGVMTDLISLVTGDDTIFNRVKMDVQKESVEITEGENKQMKGKDPCWKGYQMVGMKDKNGKKVPNCVPAEEGYVSDAQRKAVWAARNDAKEKKEEVVPFEGPYTKVKGDVTDKSGAKHTAVSKVRHLARLALQRQMEKQKKLKEECDDCYEEIIEDFEVGGEEYLDEGFDEIYEEIEYQGRKVTLNKPFAGDAKKKRYVYVKNEKGNVVKVGFGDPNMEIKRDDPERRKNFRARHNCDNPGPKWKARYWSCKYWSSTPVSKM